MKNRWIALIALPLLAAGCARGGEGDAGAALNDTASSATLTPDTAMPVTTAPAPAMDSAAAIPADSVATTDSTTQADSAAHP